MSPASITPLVLTWNEEANIRRCLERLTWAERIVVIDSGSTDATLEICAEFPNVEVVTRQFDSFAEQCNAGLEHIATEWVLSLDADYLMPFDFHLFAEKFTPKHSGLRFAFRYLVHGKPLRACLYPPRTILYKREFANYLNDGHGHRVVISDKIEDVKLRVDHDDRKPLSRWLDSQIKYARLEAEKLESAPHSSGLPDRLRKMIWPAAPAAFFYTLFVKGVILDGWPGLFYALQRTYAELVLSLVLLEKRVRRS
jgi:glycosyltransferase involved in cell wall biosynthesis